MELTTVVTRNAFTAMFESFGPYPKGADTLLQFALGQATSIVVSLPLAISQLQHPLIQMIALYPMCFQII